MTGGDQPKLAKGEGRGAAASVQSHERILRLSAVLDQTGLTRSTLYRKIQAGTFPRQLRIAERCTGWRQSAIIEWLKDPMSYEDDSS
ncbi:AlpA family phage regulatory protein [Novosphingobium sp. BL-8H]|uniref:helix-turn-helix transcriptional regulator n=1 Tax=Novosphingobium sp. BL-8H TaxID=3127640 RepID=UPI0037569EF8